MLKEDMGGVWEAFSRQKIRGGGRRVVAENFDTRVAAAEAQKYLVTTFSAPALPSEDDGDYMRMDVDSGARRLEVLQATNARLIAGSGAIPITGNLRATSSLRPPSSISPPRVRIVKDFAVQPVNFGAKRHLSMSPDSEECRPSAKRQRISRI
ncbi:hypothetical protein B0H13DRAFT_2271019 [Mycena leptocephala]|nr:hypothetical protein B0H13DRAFT_2271019 [Mycena leptocephala]